MDRKLSTQQNGLQSLLGNHASLEITRNHRLSKWEEGRKKGRDRRSLLTVFFSIPTSPFIGLSFFISASSVPFGCQIKSKKQYEWREKQQQQKNKTKKQHDHDRRV